MTVDGVCGVCERERGGEREREKERKRERERERKRERKKERERMVSICKSVLLVFDINKYV